MTLNHLLVEAIQTNRETAIARHQLARRAASETSSRDVRLTLITQLSNLLHHR